MSILLDILLGIPLVWALWAGFRNGIIVQVGGIAGLLLGIWLAFRYGPTVGAWLNINPDADPVIGFIVILLLAVLLMAVVGRLLKGVFRFAGLAALDRFGGALLSLLKIGIILGLLLYAFDNLNRSQNWVKEEKLHHSYLYKPLIGAAKFTFPYMDMVKEKLIGDE